MSINTDSIRNIAIIGHGATGKTTFAEHILFTGGVLSRPETVESGKTVSDYTEEEIDNKFSIKTSLLHTDWNDVKINLLDTPGASDFIGEVIAAFRATESALMLVGARSGVQIETIKLWRRLNERQIPRMVFINKMDIERADFQKTIDDLNENFDIPFVPVTMPIGSGTDFKGVIDLVNMKAYMSPRGESAAVKAEDIPADFADAAAEMQLQLIESAAEGDESLMEKYFEEETLSPDEIRQGISKGFKDNKLVPVLCGAALQNAGIQNFLDFAAENAPSPKGKVEKTEKPDEGGSIEIGSDGRLACFCFKTSIDQFSGKLSYVKVVSGTLSSDSDLYIPRENQKTKTSKIYSVQGKKLEEASELPAGDIGVLVKIAAASTNDTICSPDQEIVLEPLQLPQPVYSIAINAASKKDEDKLAQHLHRAADEDMTFQINFNPETKETVISGMGEQHINMILDKIKDSQKIEVETKVPKIAYRETITKPASATYRHKKQSGGHGQFGEVSIQIKPIERGEYYQFENQIRGMAVSKGYVPGIEKGLHEAMNEGIIAGYPVVDIFTALVDGKEHPVDSSEMAFKLAARGALKEAMSKAGPVLLEPVMNLSVFVDEQYLGDVLSDLSSKRGRVLGQEPVGGGILEIKAQVPASELLRYSIDLRSITSGTGSFEMEFSHYNPISGKIADDIVKASQATESEE